MKIVAVVVSSEPTEDVNLAVSNLEQGAMILGEDIKVEVIDSKKVTNELDAQDIREASAVIVAMEHADSDLSRFEGKPLRIVSIKEAIHHAKTLIQDAQTEKFERYHT